MKRGEIMLEAALAMEYTERKIHLLPLQTNLDVLREEHCNIKRIKNSSQSLLKTLLEIISDVLGLMQNINHKHETGRNWPHGREK